MIPSPTKLALLTGIVLLAGDSTTAGPTRYDQRQDGELNFRADIEDVVLVAVPPKDYIANGMTWVGANFIRHNPNRIPSRAPSKHGFVPTEKSPYKVDLGKSTIPVIKLQSPVVEEVKLFALRDADKSDVGQVDQSKILMSVVESSSSSSTSSSSSSSSPAPTPTTESKTVKKELKATTETMTPVEKVTESKKTDEKKQEDAVAEEKKKGSTLVVVGGSDPESLTKYEDCGPKAYRDSTGKCIYE